MQLVLIDSSSSSGRQSVTPSRVMNRSQLLPALIALLAITSLSVASTTLETSLTTDPDEEINPNWESLPIGQDDAAAIQESIEGGGGGRATVGAVAVPPTPRDPRPMTARSSIA